MFRLTYFEIAQYSSLSFLSNPSNVIPILAALLTANVWHGNSVSQKP